MKTVGQKITTTQHNFNEAIANIGDDKVIIQVVDTGHRSKGLSINLMDTTPIVQLWKDSAIRVDVHSEYLQPSIFHNTSNNTSMRDIPEIAFERVFSDSDIEKEIGLWADDGK